MIKLKMCNGCSQPKYIWKSDGKEKFCKECWFSKNPPTQIKKSTTKIAPISKKKKEEIDEYTKLRKLFMIAHPFCEAKLQGCIGEASDVHHLYSGKDRSKYFLKMTSWKAVCRNCHHQIHDVLSTEELLELGLRLIDF